MLLLCTLSAGAQLPDQSIAPHEIIERAHAAGSLDGVIVVVPDDKVSFTEAIGLTDKASHVSLAEREGRPSSGRPAETWARALQRLQPASASPFIRHPVVSKLTSPRKENSIKTMFLEEIELRCIDSQARN